MYFDFEMPTKSFKMVDCNTIDTCRHDNIIIYFLPFPFYFQLEYFA